MPYGTLMETWHSSDGDSQFMVALMVIAALLRISTARQTTVHQLFFAAFVLLLVLMAVLRVSCQIMVVNIWMFLDS